MTEGLPWRGPGPDRPDLALPPDKVKLRRSGIWRKQWRYIGVFSDELLLCAARVQVGPVGQTFWAVWDRESQRMIERTKLLGPIARGEVWTELDQEGAGRIDWAPAEGDSRVRIEAPAAAGEEQVRAFLHLGAGTASPWVESVCPTEDGLYTWTRKRVSPVACDVRIGSRRIRLEARAVEDESCGYHERHTVWDWSAGIGRSTDGRELGWNLVRGINDPATGSERAIWIDGEPTEPAPVVFEGLDALTFDGARLEFSAICERSKQEKRPFIEYSYRQPFGTFTGTLPGGIELEHGIGVIEHHDARW